MEGLTLRDRSTGADEGLTARRGCDGRASRMERLAPGSTPPESTEIIEPSRPFADDDEATGRCATSPCGPRSPLLPFRWTEEGVRASPFARAFLETLELLKD